MGLFSLLTKKCGAKRHPSKQGYRTDLGKIYFRSGWEANYCRYLIFLKKEKIIYAWQYEPDTFWFNAIKRGVRSYLPDFKIWEYKGSEPHYIEVKGYMDSKSKTKIKRMAKYYPNVRLSVVGAKEYTEIKNKLGNVIPNWE